jgi:hypothetical protein
LCACADAERASFPAKFVHASENDARRPAASFYAQLFLSGFPRYNRIVLKPRFHSRFTFAALLAALSFSAASCVAPLGPGYTIEKQNIQVYFVGAPEPRIRIEADYLLKNTGNQPLDDLELRLPGKRRFHYSEPRATWDGAAIAIGISSDNPRNSLVSFSQPWTLSSRRTLHVSYELSPAAPGETTLSFAPDAFFLPAQGWSPELLPSRGSFATGGVPPKEWAMSVRVPAGFLIHMSGAQVKASRKGGEWILVAKQGEKDLHPFLIAGRYKSAELGAGKEKVFLWTRKPQDAASLRPVSDALARTIQVYDTEFGNRSKESSPTWIVECPIVAGCFTNSNAPTVRILDEEGEGKEPASAEMVSLDTMVVDLSGGAPKLAAAVAPSLASSWLGYAQNPGFYEQDPPLSAFPAFAASIGREAAEGADSRSETIRRVLRLIPGKAAAHHPEERAVIRAKSFLFFYALQDRYGPGVFRKAVRHMLYARRERGLELSDLIAAFEQETHQNVAEFVRLWMKRPGVPDEFRARYNETAATAHSSKEESRP